MRSLRLRDNSEESTFELNLAPMMDMLVSIIPFMLLSATFLQVMLIDIPLPTPVLQALQKDRAATEHEVVIDVQMNSTGFIVEVKGGTGKSTTKLIPKTATTWDYAALHHKLVEVKQSYPKIFHVNLSPEEGVDYNSIVRTMDASRSMEKADPKILIENAETPLLFPDVVLSNVMG